MKKKIVGTPYDSQTDSKLQSANSRSTSVVINSTSVVINSDCQIENRV